MNECHARGFLARLKGDCNATREALNLCLRKEVCRAASRIAAIRELTISCSPLEPVRDWTGQRGTLKRRNCGTKRRSKLGNLWTRMSRR